LSAAVSAPGGQQPGAAVDGQHLRLALGRFTTGVTVITCVDEQGAWVGLTANSFNSLSLDPPLVLWSLRASSANLPAFSAAGRFAINVLSVAQIDLSRRFAARGDDKFAAGVWSLGEHGSPVLAGCAAVFECLTHAQHAIGDHTLFVGRVLACSETLLPPLVYQGGHYHSLGNKL
jgi:3-hydroxy-9,10-secoandrosta-1,3,5(10)-triene-9,17-dione monooxygenase reductase component